MNCAEKTQQDELSSAFIFLYSESLPQLDSKRDKPYQVQLKRIRFLSLIFLWAMFHQAHAAKASLEWIKEIPSPEDASSFYLSFQKSLALPGKASEIESIGLDVLIKSDDDKARLQTISVEKLAKFGIKEGQAITHIDTQTGAVTKCRIKSKVTVILFGFKYLSFQRYAILLSDDKKDHELAMREDMKGANGGPLMSHLVYIGDKRTFVSAAPRKVPLEKVYPLHPLVKSGKFTGRTVGGVAVNGHELIFMTEAEEGCEDCISNHGYVLAGDKRYYDITTNRDIVTRDRRNVVVADWMKGAAVLSSVDEYSDGPCQRFTIVEEKKISQLRFECSGAD